MSKTSTKQMSIDGTPFCGGCGRSADDVSMNGHDGDCPFAPSATSDLKSGAASELPPSPAVCGARVVNQCWSVPCELPSGHPGAHWSRADVRLAFQHTDLFQVSVMLWHLAREMRARNHTRISTPRPDTGFDRFSVEDVEMAATELGQQAGGIGSEIDAFTDIQSQLEADHMGEWIVMRRREVIGYYASFDAAATDAVSRFGRGPYLIREIGAGPLMLPLSVQSATLERDK